MSTDNLRAKRRTHTAFAVELVREQVCAIYAEDSVDPQSARAEPATPGRRLGIGRSVIDGARVGKRVGQADLRAARPAPAARMSDLVELVGERLDGGLILSLYPRSDLAKDAEIDVGSPQSTELSLGQLVRTRTEVDELLHRAEAAGAAITEAHDRPWGIYSGYFRDPDGHLWEVIWKVEVAGIEPASFGAETGLLRAQPAAAFLGLSSHAGKLLTGPVAVGFPDRSRDRTDRLSLLTDARHRAEGTPGLTDQLLLRQQERGRAD